MTTDPTYRVETRGDFYHRFVDILDAIASEYRLHFDDYEIHTKAVNPTNTSMISLAVPADAFIQYHADGETIGVSTDQLDGRTNFMRKGRGSKLGDDVEIWGDQHNFFVKTDREEVSRTSSVPVIDPASVRMEPDLPDLDLRWTAHPDPEALCDVLEAIDDSDHEHIQIGTDSDTDHDSGGLDDKEVADLYFHTEGDDGDEEEYRFPAAAEAEEGTRDVASMYSADLLSEYKPALEAAEPEKVTLEIDNEFPVSVTAEGCEYGIGLKLLSAPRIASEDGDNAYTGFTSWGEEYNIPKAKTTA